MSDCAMNEYFHARIHVKFTLTHSIYYGDSRETSIQKHIPLLNFQNYSSKQIRVCARQTKYSVSHWILNENIMGKFLIKNIKMKQ
jgi:hypothetical protein